MKNDNRADNKYNTTTDTLQAASTTDFTGLIPAAPMSRDAYNAYLELYPFLPPSDKKDDPNP